MDLANVKHIIFKWIDNKIKNKDNTTEHKLCSILSSLECIYLASWLIHLEEAHDSSFQFIEVWPMAVIRL